MSNYFKNAWENKLNHMNKSLSLNKLRGRGLAKLNSDIYQNLSPRGKTFKIMSDLDNQISRF
jgi:hypothetical protein